MMVSKKQILGKKKNKNQTLGSWQNILQTLLVSQQVISFSLALFKSVIGNKNSETPPNN